jgi:hypothetical protein
MSGGRKTNNHGGRKKMKNAVLIAILGLSAVIAASAQEESHVAAQIGAGFTQGVGRTGMYTDTGWNVSGGIGYNLIRIWERSWTSA